MAIGKLVIHALDEKVRAYYNLEKLWSTDTSNQDHGVVHGQFPSRPRRPQPANQECQSTKCNAIEDCQMEKILGRLYRHKLKRHGKRWLTGKLGVKILGMSDKVSGEILELKITSIGYTTGDFSPYLEN
ncbi:hypothetical protein RND71_003297 [Anisodus tanguticus]|uniref:Uncharacterized protein n=1 Tax=Anisodus tanguticus TaxID=243964 RepID=A0AAE1SYE2_9SOLA|nr:hypothetical protein RND71_003297 [Anisodus tanguticus]